MIFPFFLEGHKLKAISNKDVNVVYGPSFIGIDPTSLSIKMSVANKLSMYIKVSKEREKVRVKHLQSFYMISVWCYIKSK